MLPSPQSPVSLSIEEGLTSPTPKPSISRRTLLLSLAFLTFFVITVVLIISLSLTLPSSSSSSSSTVPYGRSNAHVSSLWVMDSRASADDEHEFHWLFPQQNLDWLQTEFEALTDPASPRFQQWTTHEALMEKIAPSVEVKATVNAWLLSQGVKTVVDQGDSLKVTADVKTVETMFSTTLHNVKHVGTGQEAIVSGPSSVSVPAELAPHLEALHGIYDYPHAIYHLSTYRSSLPSFRPQPYHNTTQHTFKPMQVEETNKQCTTPSSFYPLAPPSLLSTAYNFALRNTDTTSQTTRAMVTAFGGQAYSPNDLQQFHLNVGASHAFSPSVTNPTTNTQNLNRYGPGVEANLDIQAVYQIAPTQTNQFYASSTSGSLLAAMTAIASQSASTRPQVVSISYGFGASDYSYQNSDAGRTDSKFQQMGALGITVIVSAGDDGTASAYNRQCSTSPNSLGYGTISPLSSPMIPQYPASSQYVLSVGETDFVKSATSANQAYGAFGQAIRSPPECNNCPTDQGGVAFLCQQNNLGEQPCSAGAKSGMASQTTGGGFSLITPRPSWQSAAVSNYLSTTCTAANGCTLPSSSYYYSNNRAFPDVAAFGGYFGIVYNGKESVVSGTSVSAPVWAGLISRLNEANIAAKGTTLGFVNPLFYTMYASTPSTFNDITTGDNICPQGNTACANYVKGLGGSTSCAGFRAAPGWDPVSGLGSPNIGNIINYINTH